MTARPASSAVEAAAAEAARRFAAETLAEIEREDASIARALELAEHDRETRVRRAAAEAAAAYEAKLTQQAESHATALAAMDASSQQRAADLERRYEARIAELEQRLQAQIAELEQRHEADLADLERRHEARTAEEVERAVSSRAAADAATHAQAIAQLKGSPEWLLGDRLWNRAQLRYVGEPAARSRRRLRDLRNRAGLALAGVARRLGLKGPGAVVAACWSFPIHSQTFVYQEMSALPWAGLDYRVFCCDTNPRTELPSAFAGLWAKRLVMQTDWERGLRDLAHFRRTRPERVDALLATLAQATGRTAEALLNQPIVLTGFTFARHVELSGARYLHTYFFYDQSFLALMAAFLLDIPRGITAYADHMLGDYEFKLVPLHLQLADIVVATSARIKQELGAIGEGRVHDKIIVKPNGIDITRFRHVPPAERLALAGVPEIVAVNRIEPKKGLIHLVDAMAQLRDRGVAARVNIVGGVDVNTPTSAACHRELVARIDALQLAEVVVLHGVKQQHEFAPIAARSRVFVAPYVEVGNGDKDGIPTALLEAMSTGLPVVATDAGSITEAARDGIEALIVPQRDPNALADALQRLLTDRDLYLRMADAARARAVNEFDITVTERRLHERIAQRLAPTSPSASASARRAAL
jgi:glycosyltransferase involved in cell wall biosynthesis